MRRSVAGLAASVGSLVLKFKLSLNIWHPEVEDKSVNLKIGSLNF